MEGEGKASKARRAGMNPHDVIDVDDLHRVIRRCPRSDEAACSERTFALRNDLVKQIPRLELTILNSAVALREVHM